MNDTLRFEKGKNTVYKYFNSKNPLYVTVGIVDNSMKVQT